MLEDLHKKHVNNDTVWRRFIHIKNTPLGLSKRSAIFYFSAYFADSPVPLHGSLFNRFFQVEDFNYFNLFFFKTKCMAWWLSLHTRKPLKRQ